jgi:hypothetical protein
MKRAPDAISDPEAIMLHHRISAVSILLVVSTAFASQVPSYDLPVDPSIPIITLNYVGGLTELPRQNINPVLTIRADGSVTISDALGRTKDIETNIPGEEIQELLRFSLREQSFLDFNTGDTLQAIAAQNALCGRFMRVEDGAATVIHIRTVDLDHEARFNSLGVFAETYPGVKPLRQLWTIERRLNDLVEELKAGGKDAVATAAEQATLFVKQQQNPVTFKVEDLQRTVMTPDGRRMLEFKHDSEDGTTLSVNVEYKSEQPRQTSQGPQPPQPPSISGEISRKLPAHPPMSCRTGND